MKEYIKRFFKEEDGVELIEIAIGIAIMAVVAGIVLLMGRTAGNKVTQAQELIDGIEIPGSLPGASGTP